MWWCPWLLSLRWQRSALSQRWRRIAEDMREDAGDLAVDTPMQHRAVETSAAGVASPLHVETSAGTSIAEMPMADVLFTVVADITVAGDMALDLDSVSASMRLTDMQRRCAIERCSMTNTATGGIIPVAQRLMSIKL